MTRRSAVLLGLHFGSGAVSWGFTPGEFWNDKQPADWSEKERQRLLTNSPWAKAGSIATNFESMGAPDGGRGPMGGDMPGGRGGGPPMGGPGMGGPGMGGPGMDGGRGPGGPGGPAQFRAIVRWESAASLREIPGRTLPADAAGFHVISVSGLSMMRGGAGRSASQGDSSSADERMRAMQDRMRQTTRLRRKDKDSISADKVLEKDGTIYFYFSVESAAISLDDKEVLFQTEMGPIQVRAKFAPKEMRYHGKLAL